MFRSRFLKLLLCAMFLGILLAVPVNAQEQPDECQDPSSEKANSEECKTPNGGDTSSAPEPAEDPSPTPTQSSEPQEQSNTSGAETTDLKGAQEPPTSEAPPGEQGNITSSGTCLLEVRFLGFDTGPSTVITNVFAVPPSGDGLIFTQSSEEVLRRRESGNTVSLIKTYDLSGSVGGLQPTSGGFQVRVEVHVTGPDGRTTTRTKIDRLPCVAVGAAAAAVLPVEILAPGLLPETGVNVNDYLIISMMMFITGASFIRRARVTG